MKRRIKDSEDYGWLFRNYGKNLSVMISESDGEADFGFNQYDFDDFLNICDDLAETINGFYNFYADYDSHNNDCFVVEFFTATPLDINPEDYDYDTSERVGGAKFQIVILPKMVFANDLQEYAEKRNGYYGGR